MARTFDPSCWASRSAAGGDANRSKPFEVGLGNVFHLVEKNATGIQRNTALHGVAHRTRLFVNLLQHEMFEAALFRHDRIPGNTLDHRLHRVGFEVCYTHRILVDNGHLAVTEKKDVARVLQNRRDVGGNKKLAVSKANNDWWPLSDGDDHVRLVGVD